MIRLLLIIAFLIGSPRDIANRPTKHVAPKRVDIKKLILKIRATPTNSIPVKSLSVTPSPRWVDWAYDNYNTNTLTFIVDSRTNLTAPWQTYARGTVAPLQMVVFRVYETNRQSFFRAGFVWP